MDACDRAHGLYQRARRVAMPPRSDPEDSTSVRGALMEKEEDQEDDQVEGGGAEDARDVTAVFFLGHFGRSHRDRFG